MIEYIYDAIKATAGTDETIAAKVSTEAGEPITAGVKLMLYINDNSILTIEGIYLEDVWVFPLSAEHTRDLKGRCWYCIKHDDEALCFKQPIYFV